MARNCAGFAALHTWRGTHGSVTQGGCCDKPETVLDWLWSSNRYGEMVEGESRCPAVLYIPKLSTKVFARGLLQLVSVENLAFEFKIFINADDE